MARLVYIGRETDLSDLAGSCLAMGVYDGFHIGHQGIISLMLSSAPESAQKAIITFDRDPDELFNPEGLHKIMSNEARLETLSELPLDTVYVLPFTREFASMEPDVFLDRTFGANVPAQIHVGRDFGFGACGRGGVSTLEAWGAAHGMQVFGYDLIECGGIPVTATRIRQALMDADVDTARALLGRPYQIRGIVQQGRGEGTDMGFATANLLVPPQLLCLQEGVYGAVAEIDGIQHRCALSVGVSPTFRDRTEANIEAHILDFSGNLYGRELVMDILAHIRPMIEFSNVDELIATVMENIRWVREDMPIE